MAANRKFVRNGHQCTMDGHDDIFWTKYPDNSTCSKLFRAYFRFISVSEVNKKASVLLRSHAAVQKEQKRNFEYFINVIHPYSDAKMYWELIMIVVYNVYFWAMPFHLCFSEKYCWMVRNDMFSYSLVIFFVIDMILNFNIGFVKGSSKEITMDRKEIAKHYLTTYFLIDFISLLPMLIGAHHLFHITTLAYYSEGPQFMELVRYLRIPTMIEYKDNLFEQFKLRPHLQVIFAFYIYLCYCHIITCVLYVYNRYDEAKFIKLKPAYFPSERKWALVNTTTNTKWDNYVYAYYVAMTLITKSSSLEQFKSTYPNYHFSIIVWIFSELMFTYYVVILTQTLCGVTSSRTKYDGMVRQLHEYIRHKQFPKIPQHRLLQYYEFRFQKSYFREYEILSSVSGQLRQEIVLHNCRQLVENVIFFKNLPLSLLVRIVSCLRSEVYLANDVIIRANTPGDAMYFIASGSVAIFTPVGVEICHLEDGAHFGEVALVIREEKRVASVVAVENCELYKLNQKDFIRAILPYPDLLERIEHIATERFEKARIIESQSREYNSQIKYC